VTDTAGAEAAVPDRANDARQWRLALIVVAAAGIARLVMASVVPLFPDETYYWEWSRRPAASYYDHPPGIAAAIAFGTALLGHTRLGVRLGANVLGLVGSLAMVALARRLGGGRAALVTALVLACMPLAAAGLVLATPDAPLLASFAIATWAVTRALEREPGTLAEIGWWCAAGVALGAALLSKYTAVLLPVGVALGLALDPRLRKRLLTPGPWIGFGLGVAAFAPVIMWNAELGWPSFAFQLEHGFGPDRSGTGLVGRGIGAINRELELLGGQLGLVSPILFALMSVVVLRALRYGRRGVGDPRRTILASIALVVVAVFAVSALRRSVEPNWPAPAYVPAAALLGAAAWSAARGRWLRWGLGLGALLVGVIYVHALSLALPVDARRDPLGDAHGWDSLAEVTEEARRDLRERGCPEVWVASNRYQEASALAFHVPGQPTVFSFNVRARGNQYDLWPRFEDLASPGDCLVYVNIDDGWARSIATDLAERFASAEEVGAAHRTLRSHVTADYRLWAFVDWAGVMRASDP
jgi:4-amino-4-deoxy-L-arabinose transferase-like glycosyltransferase